MRQKWGLQFLWIGWMCLGGVAQAQENYYVDWMRPRLEQQWARMEPISTATNALGELYVLDRHLWRLLTFSPEGTLLASWVAEGLLECGSFGGLEVHPSQEIYLADACTGEVVVLSASGDRLRSWALPGGALPGGLAIDAAGYIYVANRLQHQIMQYRDDGTLLRSWGSRGSGDGQFNFIFAAPLAIGADDTLYVGDFGNARVQQFTLNGQYLRQFGGYGDDAGQFSFISGMATDSLGFLYVADQEQLQRFNIAGQFVSRIAPLTTAGGEPWEPWSVSLGRSDVVYAADSRSNLIGRFTPSGAELGSIGSDKYAPGHFDGPGGVASDSAGNVYVADINRHRITKLARNGEVLLQWGAPGTGPGEFGSPFGVAVDGEENVYVTERESNRVQKFSSDGVFLLDWGRFGLGPGTFDEPWGIAVNSRGEVFVSDAYNHRIQVFDTSGNYIRHWIVRYSDADYSGYPFALALEGDDLLYVTDTYYGRVTKFTTAGEEVWGSEENALSTPAAIAVDAAGNVYIGSFSSASIMRYTADGTNGRRVASFGTAAGQFIFPAGITVIDDDALVVSDSRLDRVQKLVPGGLPIRGKAILVAGSGPYEGNSLWPATQYCVSLAYRTLLAQGYSGDQIYLLHPNDNLELDNNPETRDVDAPLTQPALETALAWAADAHDILVYMVGHGGERTFRLNATENISPSVLDGMLDARAGNVAGTILLVLDACQAGSFTQELQGERRIVVASSSGDEAAYFLSSGVVSFSNYFWNGLGDGLNVQAAFETARDALAVSLSTQTPELEDSGNGQPNEPGDGLLASQLVLGFGAGDIRRRPVIPNVEIPQSISGTTTAPITTGVIDHHVPLQRVWATIRPQSHLPATPDNPFLDLPELELQRTAGGHWSASYTGFTETGVYDIRVYARDVEGTVSLPVAATLSVNNPLRRRAVVVIGGAGQEGQLFHRLGRFIYGALRTQGYSEETITYLTAETQDGRDGGPTRDQIREAIAEAAREETSDLLFCYVGPGSSRLLLLPGGPLLAQELDGWLDEAQRVVPGVCTVLLDHSQSGASLSVLLPPEGRQRIAISGTDAQTEALFAANGLVSFSQYFWQRVLNGDTVASAFSRAAQALNVNAQGGQSPQLDDTGDGAGNSADDGRLASTFRIGMGYVLAGDEPTIGEIVEPMVLGASTEAQIWVQGVEGTSDIARVVAAIVHESPTGSEAAPVVLDLALAGGSRYEAEYAQFVEDGIYHISVFAVDIDETLSPPAMTQFYKGVDCFPIAAPAELTATAGSRPDGVALAWSSVSGAIAYDILRNVVPDPATAETIGSSALPAYLDTTAEAGLAGGGCDGAAHVQEYYYWVVSRSRCGESLPSDAARGHRGLVGNDTAQGAGMVVLLLGLHLLTRRTKRCVR